MVPSTRAVALVLAVVCLTHTCSGAGLRKTLFFGNGGSTFSTSSIASASSTSGSSFSSSSSSSSSSFSTSSGAGGCESWTRTSASGGASAGASGKVAGPCDAVSDSTSKSKGDETVTAEATATAAIGKAATAIASAIGAGDGVDVIATAVADAVKEGEGEAIAIAVAEAIKDGCPKDTKKADCPKNKAAEAVVAAHASAKNEAEGLAFAEALALGLVSKDKGVPSVFASATSQILKNDKCKKSKPLFTEAKAVAIGLDKEREFVDALDFDVQIAECLFPSCTGDLLACCSLEVGEECSCSGKDCSYSLFKNTPEQIWKEEKGGKDETCICPSSS